MLESNCYAVFQDILDAYKRSSRWDNLLDGSKVAYRKPIERLLALSGNLNSSFTTGFAMQLPVAVARSRSAHLDEDEWNRAIRSLNVSNAEKNKMFIVLNAVYRGAKLPMMEFQPLPHEVEETDPFTKEEIELLWSRAMPIAMRVSVAFVRFCFYTGMRPWCEALVLKKSDVGPDVIEVRGSKRREKDKVARMVRVLPETKECLDFIAQMGSRDLVWVNEKGKPLLRGLVKERLNQACELFGVKHKEVYDARRGIATEMLRKGYLKQEVADLLGHKDLRTTDKYDQRSKKEKALNFKGV